MPLEAKLTNSAHFVNFVNSLFMIHDLMYESVSHKEDKWPISIILFVVKPKKTIKRLIPINNRKS